MFRPDDEFEWDGRIALWAAAILALLAGAGFAGVLYLWKGGG